ncbi:probable LRR receptor-like serine/threonine-protein kinase At3g47570 isoform X3 [Populus trichocarpa]|uniref:probable LRR receptor-like serine/threonine-protein kinase At3g47570 isoform X3 n=1 Tax=Populus trichocarpa TaxID=3694 RepID=UPI00227832A4|nr:probable LRR receptor-like serine/threonine-protein kinase At3g47570 isoform X3 [Populus trichocarpa]
MSSFILWFLSFQIIQHSFSFSLARGGSEIDKLSLLAFKAQISDPPTKLSSWNESVHFCQWSGVTCGRRHQRVIELDLHSSQLVGSLSPHIGNLSFLSLLRLENNSFTNTIPREIDRLVRLQTLILGNNSFTGEIPANISHCSNLLSLNLEGNNLTGNLPAGLGSLSKLQVFSFRKNNLGGKIPPSFENLSSIIEIDGTLNNLQGGIPSSIGKLKTLNFFSLGSNNLSGTIPASLYNISSLIHFSLPYNQFHGTLPPNIGLTLPNLQYLGIHDNRLSGQLPATLINATKFTEIYLSYNKFTGKVPTLAIMPNLRILSMEENGLGKGEDDDLSFLYTLSNSSKLEDLYIDNNNFGGVLPDIISNFSTKLKQMAFGSNQIRGTIPDGIGNLASLEALGLERNQLTGSIPNSIGKLQNLVELYLNENKLSGSIPSSLGNIISLLQINFNQNSLQGSIPASLGNCRNLLLLALSQNNLSGPIPKEVLSISSLSMHLVLSENQLSGSLPFEVGQLKHLGHMDFSKNRLSGEIPSSLGSCESLEHLSLDGNFFQGPISDSLRSLRALQDLNLSHNNLTGQIPKFLGDFKLLQSLDLSFNDLKGEVPMHGVFENTSAVSIAGNKNLCGGILQLNLPTCRSKSTKPKSSTKLALIVGIPCGFIGLIFITSFLFLCCLKKSLRKTKNELSCEMPFRTVAYKDLLQATNGFSSGNLVGAGSFGSVYKGVLAFDGVIVAVKVFNLLREGASKSFMRECAALLNIRHRNLVKVLYAYAGVDLQGDDFKALVYEFKINGSLEEWLHPNQTLDQEVDGPRNLNLIQRLNIAIDVANALDYLHNQCKMPIVHCDLKPSNVLLDGDMTAHVGDFGLLKFLSEASCQSSSSQTSSVGLKGTVGYAAPEYGIGSEVSTFGDVHSYGILLLEMITGKRPTDSMFRDGIELHSYVKMALPDRVVDVADPKLLTEVDQGRGTDQIVECLISISKIGVFCSEKFPKERMDISNVVAELNRAKANFLGRRGLLSCQKVLAL